MRKEVSSLEVHIVNESRYKEITVVVNRKEFVYDTQSMCDETILEALRQGLNAYRCWENNSARINKDNTRYYKPKYKNPEDRDPDDILYQHYLQDTR